MKVTRGERGARGQRGARGPSGRTGPPGPRGPAGLAGQGVGDALAQLIRRHSESIGQLRDEVATLRRTLENMRAQAKAFGEGARRMRPKI